MIGFGTKSDTKHENKIIIDGCIYSMIIFDGNILHSGGYVKKGYRPTIYIEYFTTN